MGSAVRRESRSVGAAGVVTRQRSQRVDPGRASLHLRRPVRHDTAARMPERLRRAGEESRDLRCARRDRRPCARSAAEGSKLPAPHALEDRPAAADSFVAAKEASAISLADPRRADVLPSMESRQGSLADAGRTLQGRRGHGTRGDECGLSAGVSRGTWNTGAA